MADFVVNNIKRIIREKGFRKKYIAERAGFSEQQFSYILNGRKVLRVEYLLPIASALGIEIGELFEQNAE